MKTSSMSAVSPSTIAAPLGAYSHGMLAPQDGHWLHISGQIGNAPDGTLQEGFAEQARQAWSNLVAVLRAADMDVTNLIKVTTFLVSPGDLPLLNAVRSGFLGAARPASTLLVVQALAKAEWLIEIEAVAYQGARP